MASPEIVLVIIGLSLWAILGDYFLKLAGTGATNHWLIAAGTVVYASTALGWFYAFKHIKMSSLGAIYGISTVLFLLAVGVIVFHERLNGYEMLGIVLAMVSIALLSRFG